MKQLISILLFFFCCQLVVGQQVMSRLDSTSFLIGDQTRLTIESILSTPADNIDFSKASIDSTKALEFISQSPVYKESTGGKTVYRRELLIAFFDTGAYYVPSIPVTIAYNGGSKTFLTSPIPITVHSVASDSSYVAPIKPIIKEAWRIWDAWPIAAAVLGILLIIGLIFYRRKQQQAELEVIEIPKTPFELAMIELNELDAAKFIQKGKLKEHFAQLSFTLRSYLERQFQFPALESTTREIGYSLDAAKFDAPTKKDIIDRLQRIDMIKFAKVQPDVNEIDQSASEVRSQIQQLNELIVVTEAAGEDLSEDTKA